jgi:hypothetical protein
VAVRYPDDDWLEMDISLDLAPLAEQAGPAICVMLLAICGQQNLAVMRHHVALTRGKWKECSDWKTASRICADPSECKTPVKKSPIKGTPPTAWEMMRRLSEVSMLATSEQDCWS